MLRPSLLIAVSSFCALSALAQPVLRGTAVREQCTDNGNIFSQGHCHAVADKGNRSCVIQQRKNADGSLGLVQVSIPGLVANHDRSSEKVNLKFDGAWIVQSSGALYIGAADSKTQAELKTDLSTGLVKKANIYVNNVRSSSGKAVSRTYIQYSCQNLRVSN